MYVEDIKVIQSALDTIFPQVGLERDGHYSSQTAAVVKLFQETHSMTVDGCVTEPVFQHILSISCKVNFSCG